MKLQTINSFPRFIALLLCSILALVGIAFSCVQFSGREFFESSSPNGTYSVRLKGDKGRSLLLSHEIMADVTKHGAAYVSNIFMHSTHNAFDLSFEAGFPDARWLNDSILEFYRQEYFEKGFDSLVVENSDSRSIKYLRVQAHNKFLIFDIEPKSSVSLRIPAPRGDSQWIALEGAFNDNQKIDFYQKSFNRRSTQRTHFSYKIILSSSGPRLIEV
jgi:hypothetical protein